MIPPYARPQAYPFVALVITGTQDYVAVERRAAIRKTIALLVEGKPGRALYTMVRSVERQARIEGIGYQHLDVDCWPRGGR